MLFTSEDSQTPPMSDLYKTKFKDPNHVSSLEVISSMGKKLGNRLDEGFFGRFARGLLREQVYTSFGKSGTDFGKKNFRYGKDTAAYDMGGTVGFFWDLGCVVDILDFIRGCDPNDYRMVGAIYGGLKVATQIGALAYRHYQAEKTRLAEDKRHIREYQNLQELQEAERQNSGEKK